MAKTPLPLVRGDSISEADYTDKLPENLYTVQRDIRGSQGYLLNLPGLTSFATGLGIDRGAIYSERFDKHYRVSGQRLIEVAKDGSITNLSGNTGDDNFVPITGNGLVRMAQSFNNLAIVNGKNVWYYNPTKGLRKINVNLPDEKTPPTTGKLTYSFTGETSYQADRTAAGFESIDSNMDGIFNNIGTYGYLQDNKAPEQVPPQSGISPYQLTGNDKIYQSARTAAKFEKIDANFNGDFIHVAYGYIDDFTWKKFGTSGHTLTAKRYSVFYKDGGGVTDNVAIILKYTSSANPVFFVFSSPNLTGAEVFKNNDSFNFVSYSSKVNYTTTNKSTQVESPLVWKKFETSGHTQTPDAQAVYFKQNEGANNSLMVVKYQLSNPQWFIFSSSELANPEILQNNNTFNFQVANISASDDYTTTFSTINVNGPKNADLFSGTIDIIFIDGVFFMTDGKKIYHTKFSNEERIDPKAFATTEFLPDETVGLELTQDNMVIVFGRFSTEYYVPNPANDFGFTRSQGLATKSGLVATSAKAELDGIYFKLGGKREESIGIYAIAPGQTKTIATRNIDKILATYTEAELKQAKFDAISDDGTEFLFISLSRHTLLYNHTLAKSAGLENAWTLLSSKKNDTAIPWVGINPIFDPRIARFVFGDRFATNIGIFDPKTSLVYGQKQEWIAYSPFLTLDGQSVNELEIKVISGFATSKDVCFLSETVDGETYGKEYIADYGNPQERSKRLIWRRGGYVRDYVGYKVRGIFNGRVALGVMMVDHD